MPSSNLNFSVDIYKPEDMKDVAELYEELALRQKSFFNWNLKSAAHELSLSETLLIRTSGAVAAFVTFRTYPDRLEIMAIGTRYCFSRKGLASKLMGHLGGIAAERSLPIWLEVHEGNQQAVKFYYKHGFTKIQTRVSYYSDGGHALILRKE